MPSSIYRSMVNGHLNTLVEMTEEIGRKKVKEVNERQCPKCKNLIKLKDFNKGRTLCRKCLKEINYEMRDEIAKKDKWCANQLCLQ